MPVNPALISVGAGLVGGGLFGKKKKGPQVDVAGLTKLAQDTAGRKREIMGSLDPKLQPLSQQYEGTQGRIGSQYTADVGKMGEGYLADVEKTGQAKDTAQFNLAQEQTFRQLPQVQQAIRESLAGTGGLGRGYAVTELAKAPLQAAQNLSDLTKELAIAGGDRKAAALDRVYQTNSGAALNKLGIDRDTAQMLLETGRSDILTQAAQALGIEDQLAEDLFGIEQLKLGQGIAQSSADNANRQSISDALARIGGNLIGRGIS